MDINQKFARLRELYPDDIEQIEREEERVFALLKAQEYYNNPGTQQLVAMCRRDILTARVKLAKDRDLSAEGRAELWHLIDARSWFLEMVAKDYEAEISLIDQQLEADLHA